MNTKIANRKSGAGFALSPSRGFTLLELLIVIGIIAILAAVVIAVLNPAEFLRRSRDVKRQTDLQSLNHAIVLATGIEYSLDLGAASIVYVSLADDATTTCASLGLPALPAGWSYHCVPSADLQKIDGTGWIPVNFASLATGAPLSNLPIDPVNASSSGLYYTYNIGGSWKLTTVFESAKFQTLAQSDGGIDPTVYEVGTPGIAPTLARGGISPMPTPSEYGPAISADDTLYVPAIDREDGWETKSQIQNMGGSETGVVAFFWDGSGTDVPISQVACTWVPLKGVWTLHSQTPPDAKSGIIYSVSSGSFSAACSDAISVSSLNDYMSWIGNYAGTGEPLAAEVLRYKEEQYGGYPALPGQWLGSSPYAYYLPSVYKDHNSMNSRIIIQNAGTVTASATLYYLDESGAVVHTQNAADIPAGGALKVIPGVSGPWHGSARVTSGQRLAIVVDKASELSSYVGLPSNAASAAGYVLFDQRQSKNFDTVAWVQNPSAAAVNVNVSFFDASGYLLQISSQTVPSHASRGFKMTAANRPGFWVGTAKIGSNIPVLSVLELDNPVDNAFFAWNAFPALPAENIALPLILRDSDWIPTTRLVVGNMNPNAGYSSVTLHIYDETGMEVAWLPSPQLGPGQVAAVNLNELGFVFPGFVGAARLTAVSTQAGAQSFAVAYTYPGTELPAAPAATVTGVDATAADLGIPGSSIGKEAYIPAIDPAAKIAVFNTGDTATDVTVTVWGSYSSECPTNDPGPIAVYLKNLSAKATWLLEDIPAGARSGIAASSVEKIAVTVTRDKQEGKSSYTAQPEMPGAAPFKYWVFPVLNGYDGKDSTLTVQNVGQACTSVWLYYKPEGNCEYMKAQHIEAIAPGEAVRIGPSAHVSLPEDDPAHADFSFPQPEVSGGGTFTAYVTASVPLSVIVDGHVIIDNGQDTTLATNGSAVYPSLTGDRTLYAPLFFRETGNWTTIVNVQNMTTQSAPTAVTVEFLDKQGDVIRILSDWVCRNGVRPFYLPALDDIAGGVGAVRVRSFGGEPSEPPSQGEPIEATITLENPDTGDRMSYNMLPESKTHDDKIFLSGIGKSSSELIITDFNPVLSETTAITIYFYGENGNLVHSLPLTLDDMVAKIDLSGIGGLPVDYKGSAIIVAGGGMIGAVAVGK